LGFLSRPLRGVERAAPPVVARRLAAADLLRAARLQLLGAAIARVGPSRLAQGRGVEVVALASLGLEVRPEASAGLRALVPAQAEPAQAAEDGGRGLLGRARDVGVLDAQDEGAAQ